MSNLQRARLVLAAAAAAGISSAVASTASAQMLYDPFDYTATAQNNPISTMGGRLVSPSIGRPWFEVAGTAASTASVALGNVNTINATSFGGSSSLTYAGLAQSYGDKAQSLNLSAVTNGNSSTPVSAVQISPSGFTAAGTTVYYSLIVNIHDVTTLANNAVGAFHAGFTNTTGGLPGGLPQTGADLQLKRIGTTQTYNIGIRNNAGNTTFSTATFNVDTPVFVVVGYTINVGLGGQDDAQKLWINPSASDLGVDYAPGSEPGTPIVGATGVANADLTNAINSFFIARGTNQSTAKTTWFDEVRVDTSWAQVTAPTGSTFTNGNATTNWSESGNWSGAVPNTAGKFAYFNGAGGTVNVDSAQTLGTMTFRSANAYTISSNTASGITLNTGGGAATSTSDINVQAPSPTAFGTVPSSSHAINVPITLANNVAVNTDLNQTLTLNADIGESAAGKTLTKNGAGTLYIAANGNYTGATVVRNGTMRFAALGSYNNTASIAVGAGAGVALDGGTIDSNLIGKINATGSSQAGALLLTTASDASNPIDFTAAPLNGAGAVGMSIGALTPTTLTGTITPPAAGYRLGGGAALTVNSNLTGANAVAITNGGVVKLRGTNNYSGATTVNQGATLNIDSAARLGSTTGITLDNGTIQWEGSFVLPLTVTLATGGGTFDTNGNNVGMLGVSNFANALNGAFEMTKAGTGELFMFNNFGAAGINLKGGTFGAGNESQLGPASGDSVITFDGGALRVATTAGGAHVHTVYVTNQNGLIQADSGTTLTWAGAINGPGTLTKGDAPDGSGNAGTGTMILVTDSPNFSGAWKINTGILAAATSVKLGPETVPVTLDGGTLAATASFSTSRTINLPPGGGSGTVAADGANALTLTGVITGNGGLNKEFYTSDTGGSGTVVLSTTAKTYLGTTSISHGTLQVVGDNILPTGTPITMFGGTAVLDVGTSTQTVGNVTMNKGLISGTGTGKLVSAGTYDLHQGSVTAILDGTANLTKTTGTTVSISGANTYSGNTSVSDGVLKFGASNTLPSGSGKGNLSVNSPGTLDLNSFSGTVNGLSGSGTIDNTGGGASTLTVGANDQGGTFSGIIKNTSGTLGITKTGSGTIDLTGTSNTYTGGTTVGAGTLQVKRLHGLSTTGTGTPNPVTITGGTLKVAHSAPLGTDPQSGDNAFISRPGGKPAISGTGILDLTNNDLVVDYTNAQPTTPIDVENYVRSGYGPGQDWLGTTGITSSTAADDSNYMLGVANNGDLSAPFGDGTTGPLFFGQSVDDTTVLVKFTWHSDITLDGLVDSTDAVIFSTNYQEGQPAVWMFGDQDYDGVYTSSDAVIFATNYNEALTSLPEPGALGVVGLGLLGLARRRRK